MKKRIIFVLLIMSFVSAVYAQNKKVAILETVDKEGTVPYGIRLQLRSYLTYAISCTPGYEGYDRVDMSQIMGEQNFQRTGMVSDEQIRKLGEMTGATSILVAEAATYDNAHLIITAKILNVESASVENSAPPQVSGIDPDSMQKACTELAAKLVGSGRTVVLQESEQQTKKNRTFSSIINSKERNNDAQQEITTITINLGIVSFEMVLVEAGSFIMGCNPDTDNSCEDDEIPYHRVIISHDYFIGKFEVTQEVWEAVMDYNPSINMAFDRPVENVSWNECVAFCVELSRLTGQTFRLPTEAEWEFAAHGGKNNNYTKYSGSSNISAVAWYDSKGGQTHPVGKLRPNEIGAYDMSGNVWEWCQDWYNIYNSKTLTDPLGPTNGTYKVLRGGGWSSSASNCRVLNRDCDEQDSRGPATGFRVVMIPEKL
jgi:formylglycine-generating enzyme required for sulfatase activity